MNTDGAMVGVPDFPDPSSLVSLCRGACFQTAGVRRRRYSCAIWRRDEGSMVGLAGVFDTTALGIFNGQEQGTLKMRDHLFEFSRVRQRGTWRLDADVIGEIRLSWRSWQLYMGKIDVLRKDGTHLCEVRFPLGCCCGGENTSFGRFRFQEGHSLDFVLQPNDASFERCSAGGIIRHVVGPASSVESLRPTASVESLFSRKHEQILSCFPNGERVLLFCTAVWARSIISTTAP